MTPLTPIFKSTLILGGASSGKSRFGEQMVLQSGKNPVYIATAQAHDREMRDKIAAHQNRRASLWQTIEAPFDLISAIKQVAAADKMILVDCLTLWLSNLMALEPFPKSAAGERDMMAASAALGDLVASPPCDLVLVSNEVGQGIVPAHALGRRFRDAAGLLNQHIAAQAKTVYLVVAREGLKCCCNQKFQPRSLPAFWVLVKAR